MKPISVALVYNSYSKRKDRMIGEFSYAVPEFDVTYYPQRHKLFLLSRTRMATLGHHVIWQDDDRCWGHYKRNSFVPVLYSVTDSTQSKGIYENKLDWAKREADMVFLDQDRLDRWELDMPVKRCSHAVNDVLFHDYGLEKTVDIALHITKSGRERLELMAKLAEFVKRRGYVADLEYKAGQEYAHALNRAKIVVNLNQAPYAEGEPIGRNHRMLDVMASRTCLVSDDVEVSGEYRVPGLHYVTFERGNYEQLFGTLDNLLRIGEWRNYADDGFQMILANHTWRIRAKQLREMILEEFPVVRGMVS